MRLLEEARSNADYKVWNSTYILYLFQNKLNLQNGFIFIFRFPLFIYVVIRDNMNNSTASAPLQPNGGKTTLNKLLPVAIAIILANGLVFALFYRRKNLRTSSNYLLLGLAICDFLTGTINIPHFIVFNFEVVPPTIQKDFSHWMYILHSLMAVSAAYHILVITAEKYLAIVRPLKHYLVTKRMVLKVLAGIWITSASIAVIPPLVWKNSQSRLYFIVHSSVCLVLVFVLPYAFMIYAYIVMFKAITSKRRPSSTHKDASRLHKKSINDQKCILVFAVMAAVFAFCWLPYFTIALLVNIELHFKSNISKPISKATEVFVFVRYMTSVTNPLLYTFFKRDFWQALRNLHVKREYMYRRTSSNSRSRSLQHDTVTTKKNSIADNSMLSRLSWTGETPFRANDKPKTNTAEEHVVFISSVWEHQHLALLWFWSVSVSQIICAQ